MSRGETVAEPALGRLLLERGAVLWANHTISMLPASGAFGASSKRTPNRKVADRDFNLLPPISHSQARKMGGNGGGGGGSSSNSGGRRRRGMGQGSPRAGSLTGTGLDYDPLYAFGGLGGAMDVEDGSGTSQGYGAGMQDREDAMGGVATGGRQCRTSSQSSLDAVTSAVAGSGRARGHSVGDGSAGVGAGSSRGNSASGVPPAGGMDNIYMDLVSAVSVGSGAAGMRCSTPLSVGGPMVGAGDGGAAGAGVGTASVGGVSATPSSWFGVSSGQGSLALRALPSFGSETGGTSAFSFGSVLSPSCVSPLASAPGLQGPPASATVMSDGSGAVPSSAAAPALANHGRDSAKEMETASTEAEAFAKVGATKPGKASKGARAKSTKGARGGRKGAGKARTPPRSPAKAKGASSSAFSSSSSSSSSAAAAAASTDAAASTVTGRSAAGSTTPKRKRQREKDAGASSSSSSSSASASAAAASSSSAAAASAAAAAAAAAAAVVSGKSKSKKGKGKGKTGGGTSSSSSVVDLTRNKRAAAEAEAAIAIAADLAYAKER